MDYIHTSKLTIPLDIEDGASQLESLLTGSDDQDFYIRTAGVRYKSSPEFGRMIQKYIAFLTDSLIREYPAIEFRGQVIFSKADWELLFFKNLAYLSVVERLKQIRRRIQVKLRPMVHELRQEKGQEIGASGEEVNERTIKALARLAARQELRSLTEGIDQLTTMDAFLLYRRLFEDHELFGRLAEGTEVAEEWPMICKQSLAWFNSGRISFEDAIPFLYFQGCLAGFPVKTGIRHLIVDEAQDYTALQFEILQRLFPRCSWTILGDPDQTVNPYQCDVDFDQVAHILNNQQSDSASPLIVQLLRSYRSTQEIQAFSRALLPGTKLLEHVQRYGPLPQLVQTASPERTPDLIVRRIQELKKEGWQSIAVISKTKRESEAIYEVLKDKIEITHINSELEEFHRGTVLIPAYLAKGLEFDAVLVYEVGAQAYSREAERNILYITCTRALHRLILYYSGDLSPFISAIDGDLYIGVGRDKAF
jgi:DNA helicase-2/ATP-dependent DNA helicase PcrA